MSAIERIRRERLVAVLRRAPDVDARVDALAAAGIGVVEITLDDADALAAIDRTRARGDVTVIPGAFTPTEVEAAWAAGAALVKLFPATLGGAAYVKDLLAPLADVPLLVTCGVQAQNALSFLDAGAVAVGVG